MRDSGAFQQLITWTILLVGVTIGVDTDTFMHCGRREARLSLWPDPEEAAEAQEGHWCAEPSAYSEAVSRCSGPRRKRNILSTIGSAPLLAPRRLCCCTPRCYPRCTPSH